MIVHVLNFRVEYSNMTATMPTEVIVNSCFVFFRKKDCKYFDQGRKECQFNDSCFYRHAYPDGRPASPKPRKPARQVRSADGGEARFLDQLRLISVLSDRVMAGILDSDDEDSEFYLSDSDSELPLSALNLLG